METVGTDCGSEGVEDGGSRAGHRCVEFGLTNPAPQGEAKIILGYDFKF